MGNEVVAVFRPASSLLGGLDVMRKYAREEKGYDMEVRVKNNLIEVSARINDKEQLLHFMRSLIDVPVLWENLIGLRCSFSLQAK